ncbi:hypothetical protein HA402_009324 [Bradysia odoriphaga]|nr:hypothetical protein HA402_009324 [Bradysia odoriphaga]
MELLLCNKYRHLISLSVCVGKIGIKPNASSDITRRLYREQLNTIFYNNNKHFCNSAYESRNSHSGFHSFLKWFKKDEHGRSIRNVSSSKSTKDQHTNHFNSIDEIRDLPSSHPKNGLSASSSCDSIISTATTGFAFIPPNQYRPNGNACQPEILIEAGPATDTYRQRLRAHQNAVENDKKLELTLRKKYNIFDSDTITSVDSIFNRLNGNKRPHYNDLSLPQPSTSSQIITNSLLSDDDTIGRVRKPHRRTASDSSKDKKAGAYLHVKGKRKAPDPPKDNRPDSVNNRLSTSTNSGTLSPHSTLGRKKRKAPPPPLKNTEQLEQSISEDFPTVLHNGLMDDEEIKAIIQGTTTGFSAMDKSKESSSASAIPSPENAVRCTDTLKLEKGILRSTRETTISDNKMKPDERHSSISPSSISPRPWYKRSPASNKDYAIPFKKEIVLRTMEKRKVKKSAKELESPQLPEFGFSRNSSLFEGFFSRTQHDRSDRTDDQEKRRSGIGMPNISELDREAAEIVLKEQEHQRAKRLEEHEKYFNKVNESKENIAGDNGIKFTLNNAFIQKSDRQCVYLNGNESRGSKIHFINRLEKPSSGSAAETESIFSNSVNKLSTKTVNDSNEKSSTTVQLKQSENIQTTNVVKKNDSTTVNGKCVWICGYCTLENANWRVICEVCERIRPPDKQVAGIPVIDSSKMLHSSNLLPATKGKVIDKNPDWDNKADKVMKYFRPRLSYNSLSKSSSETSVSKSTTKKPTSKVPLSPKMLSRQKKIGSRISDMNTDIVRPPSTTKSTERLTSPVSQLIDSSAVVTTVTPVFYAPSASAKINGTEDAPKNQINRNLEEVRLARLAKFSQDIKPQSQEETGRSCEKSEGKKEPIRDSTSLEREKQRLREMIRAMNARALAEKYPLIQKSVSLDDDSSTKAKTVTDLHTGGEESRLKPGTGVIKKVLNRKHYAEDKEIADNSNFASSSKMDKEKLFLKLSPEQSMNVNKPHRPDVLLIPTPIQELNEDEKSPTPSKLIKTISNLR